MRSVKERPIIMSAESVNALLSGAKTQTRRVVKPQPVDDGRAPVPFYPYPSVARSGMMVQNIPARYGRPGERLWVKETWAPRPLAAPDAPSVRYRADCEGALATEEASGVRWTSPLFMPRSVSRITLELTEVSIERLHDVTEDDALAEGYEFWRSAMLQGESERYSGAAREGYRVLWDKLNAERGFPWTANPWVWVLSYTRLEAEEVEDE